MFVPYRQAGLQTTLQGEADLADLGCLRQSGKQKQSVFGPRTQVEKGKVTTTEGSPKYECLG